ncbi:serine/threonine protein kinase [Nitzschia inconspicua]|uniref:Serine/threonine protein kinase n=1 Tax=Nitzschia inconspicua TaxID=303405 RepID=A0A9K3L9Y6_9STRA|nr:serine/threonine protein kinase [Nitzschia inconspicua]
MTTADVENRQSSATTEAKKSTFDSLLNRWKKLDDGSAPFAVAKPRKSVKNKDQNGVAIKEYKTKIRSTVQAREKSTNKPAHLQNIFGPNASQEHIVDSKSPMFQKSPENVKVIERNITSNFFFHDMDSCDLPIFIDAFEPFKVREGKHIITQGDKGDYFYIVGGNSEVAFEVNGERVGYAGEGDSFGELALLYSCRRAATVIAISPMTELYRVDQTTFRALLHKQTKKREAEKMKLLEAVTFLSEISSVDLKRLGRAMTLIQFQPGDCLVKKGDEGDAFYVVYEGQVILTEISVGSTKFDDLTLNVGDYFGERSLATNERRAANAIAKTKGAAFRIDRKTFEKVLGKFSRVIMKAQDRRILEGIKMLQNCHLEPKQFEALSHIVVDKKIKAGQRIFGPEKRTDAALFLLREGSVELSGNRTDVIKPGAYFGDDLFLLGMQQEEMCGKVFTNYTAIAREDCLCGVLRVGDCRAVFDTMNMVGSIDKLQSHAEGLKIGVDIEQPETPHKLPTRQSTERWLARASTDNLRKAVRDSINMDQLDRHHVLGEGQFGEVWLVSAFITPKYGQQYFALKIQKKDDAMRGDSSAAIKREISILGLLDHPYIVNLVHFYEDLETINILMGLVQGCELFDVIHTENEDGTWHSGIPESDAKFYTMIVADTLDYIHKKQFVYRDVKPENILIDKDGYPIICDFGFAKFVEDKTYTLCGTPNYLSPEVIMNRGHDAASDHWALVAGANPFFYDGIPQMELFQCIVREKFYPLPDELSDECFQVVDGLLVKDPSQRLGSLAGGMNDLISMKWFHELDLDELRQKKYPAPFKPIATSLDTLAERT